MAFRMDLTPPFFGLNRILNVSSKVGPTADCSNNSNDVELVQRLLALMIPGTPSLAALGFGLPAPTGRFDALTGFYIFQTQASVRNLPFGRGEIVDGCVSRARGASYGQQGFWTIVVLNLNAKEKNPAGFELLMNTFPVTPTVGT